MSLNARPSPKDEQQLLDLGYKPVLARKLSVGHLIAFGLNYLQPIGPALIFGILMQTSGGSVALPYLVAFVGILFTLYSYIVLSKRFPLCGGLYAYVARVMGKKVGILSGWLLILDYVLIPAITLASASHYIHAIFPQIHYEIILVLLTLIMAASNLVGIKFTASISVIILLLEVIIVIVFLGLCVHWVAIHPKVQMISFSSLHVSSMSALLSASAVAIFGYLGFDAIGTLAEEANSPTKAVPKAMLLCLLIGFSIAFLTGYLGVLVSSHVAQSSIYATPQSSSILFHVAKIIGNHDFALIYAVGFIIAMIATNIVGTASAARLLFSMGRDEVPLLKPFAKIHPHFKTPYISVLTISAICIVIGSLSSIAQIAELINYGALISFCLLNASAFVIIKQEEGFSILLLIPLLGIAVMLTLFVHLQYITLLFGSAWLLFGLAVFLRKPSPSK